MNYIRNILLLVFMFIRNVSALQRMQTLRNIVMQVLTWKFMVGIYGKEDIKVQQNSDGLVMIRKTLSNLL